MSERILYREFSRVAIPGQLREIVADTSVIVRDGRLVHRIHSMNTDHYEDVTITGTAVLDCERMMEARLQVMNIDFPAMKG